MIVVYNCGYVILGDININLDVITDPATMKFTSEMNSLGLKQMIDLPSHRHGHTLDIVILSLISIALAHSICHFKLILKLGSYGISDFFSCWECSSNCQLMVVTVLENMVVTVLIADGGDC